MLAFALFTTVFIYGVAFTPPCGASQAKTDTAYVPTRQRYHRLLSISSMYPISLRLFSASRMPEFAPFPASLSRIRARLLRVNSLRRTLAAHLLFWQRCLRTAPSTQNSLIWSWAVLKNSCGSSVDSISHPRLKRLLKKVISDRSASKFCKTSQHISGRVGEEILTSLWRSVPPPFSNLAALERDHISKAVYQA